MPEPLGNILGINYGTNHALGLVRIDRLIPSWLHSFSMLGLIVTLLILKFYLHCFIGAEVGCLVGHLIFSFSER